MWVSEVRVLLLVPDKWRWTEYARASLHAGLALFLCGSVIDLDGIGQEKLLSRQTDTWLYVTAGG